MSSSRDQWLRCKPAIRTGLINKSLTLPAFSAECGQDNASLQIDSFGGYVVPIVGYVDGFTANMLNAFTIDFWANIRRPVVSPSKILIMERKAISGTNLFRLLLDPLDDILEVGIVTTTLTYLFEITMTQYLFDWHRYTFTFGTVENKLRMYIDKVEVGSVVTTGNFYNNPDWYMFLGESFVSSFNGHIAEIKVYNTLKSALDLHLFGDAPAGQPADNSLKAYIKCISDDGLGFIQGTINNVDCLIPGSVVSPPFNSIVTDEYPPLRYGMSFVAKEFEITNTTKCSIKFPLKAPEDVNFGLCVSWIDEDSGLIQRRKLWDSVDGIKVNPEIADYNGESLPTSFKFECWNTDGMATIDLEEDFIVYLSLTTTPTTSQDHTPIAESTPVGDTTLAAPFPLTPYPLVYDSQQTY